MYICAIEKKQPREVYRKSASLGRGDYAYMPIKHNISLILSLKFPYLPSFSERTSIVTVLAVRCNRKKEVNLFIADTYT